MQIDPAADQSMRRTLARPSGRRATWLHLLSQLMELACGCGELLSHSERPWASATFAGTRHRVRLRFAGEEAVEAGERFIDRLPDHEFTVPGQLVADAAITGASHTALPQPCLEIEAELLLLEDA